ncbi:MAG: hypothetical protein H6799_00225 [Candidatus Nomurabacteria bacterium]|nr:MAG: hypothetical protein H6799_00225 [Candidatus Nomurabacteria bacterium]HRV76022.1 hypothetical protein [Candidatus Saccharimonadales bacterium]
MKIFKKTLILTFAFGLSLLALSLTTATKTSAATQAESESNYVYTAQSGDSYTELARASIIRYDLDTESVELNAAQVTAAETWVTQDAGSPQIYVGQEVLVSKDSVQKYSEQAAGLSDDAKSRWQAYADNGSITNGELKDKVRATVSEIAAKVEADKKSEEQKAQEESSSNTTEEKSDDKMSSRRWVVIAIVVLLVLAAVTLIRSSNQRDE